jgi:holin-like protein
MPAEAADLQPFPLGKLASGGGLPSQSALSERMVAIPEKLVVKKKLRFLGQLALLVAVYLAGNQMVQLTGIPIPGNVVGVVLLYLLLNAGLLRLEHVQDAADFLLRHLVFFFIPIAVDLMNWGSLFYRYGLMLALAILVSTTLTFLGTGTLVQWLRRKEKPCPNS